MIEPLTTAAATFQLFLIVLALVTASSAWFVVLTPRSVTVRIVYVGLVVLACVFLFMLALVL